MRIESLQYVRRRSGGEVQVALDDGSVLALDAELAVQFHLAREMHVDTETLERITEAQARLAARRRLVNYLALRRKTAAEARRYLAQLKFPESAINEAIEAAHSLGYLDDQAYAEAYTRTQVKSAKKGPRAIRQELRQRGVDKEIAAQAVKPIGETETQLAAARALAEKKSAQSKPENDPRKAWQKLYQFLLRKGYDPDVAATVTKEALGDVDDTP